MLFQQIVSALHFQPNLALNDKDELQFRVKMPTFLGYRLDFVLHSLLVIHSFSLFAAICTYCYLITHAALSSTAFFRVSDAESVCTAKNGAQILCSV